jgi:hypothetical protein
MPQAALSCLATASGSFHSLLFSFRTFSQALKKGKLSIDKTQFIKKKSIESFLNDLLTLC